MTRRSVVVAIALPFIFAASSAKAGICGISGSTVAQIQTNMAKSGAFKPISEDARYVAYMNEEKLLVLTFTKLGKKGHPAVACRKAFRTSKGWEVKTEISCQASKRACDVLAQEFVVLNAQMQRALKP